MYIFSWLVAYLLKNSTTEPSRGGYAEELYQKRGCRIEKVHTIGLRKADREDNDLPGHFINHS